MVARKEVEAPTLANCGRAVNTNANRCYLRSRQRRRKSSPQRRSASSSRSHHRSCWFASTDTGAAIVPGKVAATPTAVAGAGHEGGPRVAHYWIDQGAWRRLRNSSACRKCCQVTRLPRCTHGLPAPKRFGCPQRCSLNEDRRRRELPTVTLWTIVDDENSVRLFLGYAVGALDLQVQLTASGVAVDAHHPLVADLPCGVGGAARGLRFGVKALYADAVTCDGGVGNQDCDRCERQGRQARTDVATRPPQREHRCVKQREQRRGPRRSRPHRAAAYQRPCAAARQADPSADISTPSSPTRHG